MRLPEPEQRNPARLEHRPARENRVGEGSRHGDSLQRDAAHRTPADGVGQRDYGVAPGAAVVRFFNKSRISRNSCTSSGGGFGSSGGGGPWMRLITFTIKNTQKAMIRKSMMACRNFPYPMTTAGLSTSGLPSFSTTLPLTSFLSCSF